MVQKKVYAVSNVLNFQDYVDSVKHLVSDQIQTLMPTISNLRIHKQIEYVLQTTGKNLRASLVMLCGQSLGGSEEELKKLALAVELLHTASLVHDDILDREILRRNTLSVQARWSVKEAILVGDALASLSLGLCRQYDSEILDVMAHTCLELSDGEFMDIDFGRSQISEEEYFEKIRKKTATLFRAAAMCGSMVAKGSNKEVEGFSSFGENFGIAFQIRDDLSDVRNVKVDERSQDDYSELKGTLPIVRLGQASKNDVENIFSHGRLLSERVSDRKIALNELFATLENRGCFSYCDLQIQKYIESAIISLNCIEESSFKRFTIQMVNQLRNG